MAGNNRVYYPIQYLALAPLGVPASSVAIHGLQSVGTTTNFNLERILELGQLDIYENAETVPSIEITAEKVFDGHPLIYHLATPTATSADLANRSNQQCDGVFSIFSDAQSNASGTAIIQAYTSGLFVGSLNYTLPIQGAARESVTLVGNDRVWKTSGFYFTGQFTTGTDSPASGTMRRQNVQMNAGGSVFPSQIPGMTVSNGSGTNQQSAGQFGSHINEITIACNLGRQDLYELGRRKAYFKYANFPVDVNCTINTNVGGTQPADMITADSNATNNLVNETIIIKMDDGTVFDLGQKNKLNSVTYSGGDANGGIATASYAYQNANHLVIRNPQDPAGL